MPPRSPVLPIQVGEPSSLPSSTPLALSMTTRSVHSTGIDGKSPEGPAVVGLVAGFNSDGVAVAPMECFSIGSNSVGPAVAQVE